MPWMRGLWLNITGHLPPSLWPWSRTVHSPLQSLCGHVICPVHAWPHVLLGQIPALCRQVPPMPLEIRNEPLSRFKMGVSKPLSPAKHPSDPYKTEPAETASLPSSDTSVSGMVSPVDALAISCDITVPIHSLHREIYG